MEIFFHFLFLAGTPLPFYITYLTINNSVFLLSGDNIYYLKNGLLDMGKENTSGAKILVLQANEWAGSIPSPILHLETHFLALLPSVPMLKLAG